VLVVNWWTLADDITKSVFRRMADTLK